MSPARGFSRRIVRSSILSAAVSLALVAIPGRPALAQAPAAGEVVLSQEVENSRFATTGLIASNAVYVRCGPGDNYYPTQKLDKGAKVKVVGAKFDWLKIEPPDGSFCYVAKLYVDRHGDGKVGRVNKDSINVRAGSHLSALKIGILTELQQGEEVEITGEEQEYFKIKPPKNAYLYVNKKFVEPDPEAKPEVQAAKPETPKPETPKPETPTASTETPKPVEPATPDAEKPQPVGIAQGESAKPETPTPETPKPEVMKPGPEAQNSKPVEAKPTETTEPTEPKPVEVQPPPAETTGGSPKASETPQPAPKPQTAEKPTPQPATKPAEKAPADWTPEQAEAEFDSAEAELFASRNLPVNEMPAESLLQRYEALAKSDKLPESMRRVAEARVPGLQARATAKAEIARLRNGEESLRQKQLALRAEQEELQRRIANSTIRVFTAVGTLQPSSLQQGSGGALYRITDPSTGRTVCYVRATDKRPLDHLGQFVGIKGQVTQDPRLGAKVLTPTEITPVDPGKVHTTITAQIIPPSLIPREVSTNPNE